MDFWENYWKSTSLKEVSEIRIDARNVSRKESRIDRNDYCKMLGGWITSGVVSLIPTFVYILSRSGCCRGESGGVMSAVLEEFFSSKDVFLVITTLTISEMFELFFDNKKTTIKYWVISLNIILTAAGMHIFTVLQYGRSLPNLPYIGAGIFIVCFLNCSVGYVIICKRNRKKRDGYND